MAERTIYKSEEGRKKILALYDSMLERPEIPYHNDIYIDTSFGRAHLVETGNKDGEPLLLFHGGNSTTAYTLLVYFSAAVTVLVILLCTGTPVFGYGPVNWLAALGMAMFCTLLGHSVFSWGLKYESAAFISTAKLLEPVFAGVLGVILFGEIPKLQVILGACVVILGVYVYSRFSEARKG